MSIYGVKPEKDGGPVLVTFPDFPEVASVCHKWIGCSTQDIQPDWIHWSRHLRVWAKLWI